MKEDKVNHPKHYTSHPSGVECIDITKHYCFEVGNAIKYLWRCGLKQEEGMSALDKEIEDLEKAKWYINSRINTLKESKNKNFKSTHQQNLEKLIKILNNILKYNNNDIVLNSSLILEDANIDGYYERILRVYKKNDIIYVEYKNEDEDLHTDNIYVFSYDEIFQIINTISNYE